MLSIPDKRLLNGIRLDLPLLFRYTGLHLPSAVAGSCDMGQSHENKRVS